MLILLQTCQNSVAPPLRHLFSPVSLQRCSLTDSQGHTNCCGRRYRRQVCGSILRNFMWMPLPLRERSRQLITCQKKWQGDCIMVSAGRLSPRFIATGAVNAHAWRAGGRPAGRSLTELSTSRGCSEMYGELKTLTNCNEEWKKPLSGSVLL
jgi:hypothetical protein